MLVAALGVASSAACGSDDSGPGSTPALGGTSSGGLASGGSPSGGRNTGGVLASGGTTGGAVSTGGATQGGSPTGSSGGSGGAGASAKAGSGGTGAVSTGGTASGGNTLGGAGSGGGNANGGQTTGGAASGGAANGGAATGGAGGGSGESCPAGAVFCANFEAATLPTGAIYKSNSASTDWLDDFAIDHSVSAIGRGCLKVKSNMEAKSGSAYQMLAVPSGGDTFWVRFHIRADQILGQDGHNPFVMASVGENPNDKPSLEFAEDCGIAFNANDQVVRPDGSSQSMPCMTPLRLPANTWYCVEISFNGSTGDTQLYIDGEQKIDAKAWTPGKGAFKYVKFGVNNLHPVTRTIWYDDFAVGPARIGCPPR